MNFELGAHVQMKKFFNNMKCFSVESCVKSYCIHYEFWKGNVEELPHQCENNNCADLFRRMLCVVNERK